MKKYLALLVLLLIYSTSNYAFLQAIYNDTIKDFFDSLSIDEIEKQKKLDAQKEKTDDDESSEESSPKKSVPKETNITRFFKTWVLTGNIGPLWESAGETQTFDLAPNVKKTYAANNNTNAVTGLSLFFGVQKPLIKDTLGQIGVTVGTASDAVLTGEIWDDGNPKFNNLSYKYTIKSTRVAAKGVILLDKKLIVLPWISGSLGISYNNAYNFYSKPLIFEVLRNHNFLEYTARSFSYSLGTGFQKKISDNWQIGVGYEFTDWGGGKIKKIFLSSYF